MKSAQLYVFKTEPINFVNLLQFCFLLSRRDLYQACLPIFTGAYLDLIKGKLVYDLSPNDPDNFRNINWNSQLPLLDRILELTEQPIAFGNNDIDQVLFLKNQYLGLAQTISCSYSEEDYELVLTYKVRQHLKMQSNGTLLMTEHDQQLRTDPSINLFSYYKKSFDQQGLIPRSITYSTDYSVSLKDFFNKSKFFQHLSNLNADPTPEANHYYDQWWRLQQPYFIGEPL